MSSNVNRLRQALAKIAELASHVENGGDDFNGDSDGGEGPEDHGSAGSMVCTPKSLPARLLVKAAETAVSINPVNAPAFGAFAALTDQHEVLEPARIAVLTTKYWGPAPRRLTVSFMEPTPANLRNLIISHMNAWTKTGCISFVGTNGTGNVRISRGSGGFFSYLGTDILHIPSNRQTMNLEGFTMSTPLSEYKRVVRHETGHTLGAPHEHMRKALVARIDPQKAYAYFWQTQHWNKAMVDAQVLTPLDEASLLKTPPDQTSIMCYQLPGSITKDGQPILGGVDINPTDYAFIGQIYPKPGHVVASGGAEDAWSEAEDVEASV